VSFYYYQIKGGTEEWKAVPESRLHLIEEAMFSTILSVDSPVREDYTKEEYASIKYQGPLYFDLDDAESPASTSIHALALLEKLEKEGVNPKMCCISASGGKGFHITVDPKCFVEKQSKSGTTYLPQIYKEMAFKLAVESLDLRVYTARKGRMFRRCNVLRPNNLYKVRISYEELLDLASMAKVDAKKAEAFYKTLCSDIRTSLKVELMEPELAPGLTAMYAECLEKVNKFTRGTKKVKKVNLPQTLPSFDAMLRGEGIKQDAGFQHLALQIGIIAHMKGITCDALITAADGLVKNHKSDGSRYNSASKRKAELIRMWHYTSDNPCYTYSAKAVVSLLNHSAPDLQGMEATDAEIRAGIENPEAGVLIAEDEYEHAGVTLTARGAYTVTEFGPKKLTAVGFENVTELVSTTNNTISTIQADVYVAGKHVGNKVMDLETFNSVSSINKMSMPYGQSFSGSDTQARGVFMRLVEKARKTRSRMYAVHREGLDIVNIPFHEDEDIRKEFFVWSDVKSVTPEPRILEKNLRLKFVGFPTENGQFQTDLSQAPSLPNWLKEPENKDRLRKVMDDILSCQSPEHIGKLMGWMVACNYRMLFHKNYGKFPLLHINGAAGQGKCLGKGTPVILSDGRVVPVENVRVGDRLASPMGGYNTVTSLARGREKLYKVNQNKADSYVVNASHLLSLKHTAEKSFTFSDGLKISRKDVPGIIHVTADTYYHSGASKSIFYGWKPEEVVFENSLQELPVAPYILGVWLGDGFSARARPGKPKCNMVDTWVSYAKSLGCKVLQGGEEGCPTWSVSGDKGGDVLFNRLKGLNLINNKHIPESYKTSSVTNRLNLLAGLIDSDGTVNNAGYRFDTILPSLAESTAFIARSLGIRARITKDFYFSEAIGREHTMYHVYLTGNVGKIPTKDKFVKERKAIDNALITGIWLEDLGEGDYYGFTLDGDRLFMLGDFTATHNTEMTKLLSQFHYYKAEPKVLTPTSTLFAVSYAASGSASIPLILDEFKPQEMNQNTYDRFKLMLRDAYNCRNVERGGGNNENKDYRAVHTTQLSAPICFIAESAESESALMERVVMLTLVKPPVVKAQKYLGHFMSAVRNKEVLGILGSYIAASIVKTYSLSKLEAEFMPIYNRSRKEMMLQEGDDVSAMSQHELASKSGAKERTVYNYSVVKFGLFKLKTLLSNIYGEEFNARFDSLIGSTDSTVVALQEQTVPEWLKVMNTFADLAAIGNSEALHKLVENQDYAYVVYNGRSCIELYLRACYFKYRTYVAMSRSKPLFPNESSFLHAMNNIPALEAKGLCVELDCPGGSHIYALKELRSAGFMSPGKQ
jgi:hypothetical protein